MSRAGESPRVFFAIGPGDAVAAFRRWREGLDVDTEVSMTYSGQFFDWCRKRGATCHVVSSHPAAGVVHDGHFIVENRPKARGDSRGIGWHLDQRAYARSLLETARAYRPHVAFIDSGTTHWFMLTAFARAGIPVVPSLHNAFWAAGHRPTGALSTTIQRLDAQFWRARAIATICVSPECARQVMQLAGPDVGPVIEYRAKFRPKYFAGFKAPSRNDGLLRLMFAGRVEESKGVLDLIHMAVQVERNRPGACSWRVCGGGTLVEHLRREVSLRSLGNVDILGPLSREHVLEEYAKAHAVIVPTRSSFSEGLPKSAVESFLTQRPIITSVASNAVDVFRPAILQARADDPASYAEIVIRMVDDPDWVTRTVQFPENVRDSFLSPDGGLADAVERATNIALKIGGRRRRTST